MDSKPLSWLEPEDEMARKTTRLERAMGKSEILAEPARRTVKILPLKKLKVMIP